MFITRKGSLTPLLNQYSALSVPGNHNSDIYHYGLVLPVLEFHRNEIISTCAFLWLSSFAQHDFEIQPWCCSLVHVAIADPFLLQSSIPLNEYDAIFHCSIFHSYVDKHLGGLQFETVMDKAAVNIHIHINSFVFMCFISFQ